MVTDSSSPITINVLASPFAHINYLHQTDGATNFMYDIFPGLVQGQCNAGAACKFDMQIANIGNGSGSIYVKVTRNDTGVVLINQSVNLSPNQAFTVPQFSTLMPETNLSVTIEVGHT